MLAFRELQIEGAATENARQARSVFKGWPAAKCQMNAAPKEVRGSGSSHSGVVEWLWLWVTHTKWLRPASEPLCVCDPLSHWEPMK